MTKSLQCSRADLASLVSADPAAIAEKLAKQASISRQVRFVRNSDMQKRAFTEKLQPFLDAAKNYATENPGTTAALAGAGLGAAAGGLSNFGREKSRRNFGGGILTGALAGGLIGGGGHALSQIGKGHAPKPNDLKQNSPELLAEIKKLEPRSLASKALGGAYDTVVNYGKDHPLLATIGLGDAASHTLGGASNLVGGITTNPRPFLEGLSRLTKDNGINMPEETIKELRAALVGKTSDEVAQMLAQLKATGQNLNVSDAKDAVKLSPDMVRTISRLGSGPLRPGGADAAMDVVNKLREVFSKNPIPASSRLAGTGFAASHAPGVEALRDTGFWGKVHRAGSKGLDALTPAAGYNWKTRVLPRLGLYAGLPAAQAYWNIAQQESANNKKIQELLARFAENNGQN